MTPLSKIVSLALLIAVSAISLSAAAPRPQGPLAPVDRHPRYQSQQPVAPSAAPASFVPIVTRYCVGCHSERLRTANLALDSVRWDDPSGSAPVWEKVIQKLRTGEMPPPGRPRPDKATYEALPA